MKRSARLPRIAVIVAADGNGGTVAYPVVEMVFDNVLNLVDYVQMPSFLSAKVRDKHNNWRYNSCKPSPRPAFTR